MGLETFLGKFTGRSDALTLLGAFAFLILLNFITEMWIEIKNKDLKWDDIGRFIKPIILNGLFLLGLEVIMIPAARVPLAYDIFYSIQMAGWLGAMAYYFWGFYQNLKQMGLKVSQNVEDAMENIHNQENDEGDVK